jgi:hypothetical protein
MVFGLYVLAKIFETADRQIFSLDRHTTSGHTLKHLAAGAAGVWVLRMLKKRPPHPMLGKPRTAGLKPGTYIL